MRIATIHNFYLQPGGEDAVFSSEIEILRRHGHQVIEYTVSNKQVEKHARLSLAISAIWNGNQGRALRELVRREHPDVVHVHNTFPLLSPAVYYAAKAMGVPVVQTMHNYRPFCLNGILYRDGRVCGECVGRIPVPGVIHKCYRSSVTSSSVVLALYLAHYRLLRSYQHRIDTFIASTEFMKRLLVRMGLPEAKIVVKPNPVIPENPVILPSSSDVFSEPYIVYVGRLDVRKGIWTLLSSIEKNNLPLILVGDGYLRDEIEVWLSTRPAQRVKITGWLDSKRVQGYLRGAAGLVLPSEFYESFGNVIVEAFAQGVPVITTNIGAQSELVTHGKTGFLFSPYDSIELTKALHLLINDMELRSRLGEQAWMEYISNYSPEMNHDRLLEIYQSTISNYHAKPSVK